MDTLKCPNQLLERVYYASVRMSKRGIRGSVPRFVCVCQCVCSATAAQGSIKCK